MEPRGTRTSNPLLANSSLALCRPPPHGQQAARDRPAIPPKTAVAVLQWGTPLFRLPDDDQA